MDIAEIFLPLITKKFRNKLYYGGRAGGKSFAFADCLLLLGRESKLFVACVREVQNSIKDSVYKLLKDRAEFYELTDYVFYEDRDCMTVLFSRLAPLSILSSPVSASEARWPTSVMFITRVTL